MAGFRSILLDINCNCLHKLGILCVGFSLNKNKGVFMMKRILWKCKQ